MGGGVVSHLVWEMSEKGIRVHTASTWKVTGWRGGGAKEDVKGG